MAQVSEPKQASNIGTEVISDNVAQYCENDQWPFCKSEVPLHTVKKKRWFASKKRKNLNLPPEFLACTMAPMMSFPDVMCFTKFTYAALYTQESL